METISSEAGRLGACFAACRREGRAALVCYLTGGFPSPEETPDLLRRLERAGADVIELGIPFSDPLADGPTIQRSSERALAAGMTMAHAFEQLAAFRKESELPVVLFSYLNPILAYGVERFIADATAADADGVLITDLPVGSDAALEHAFEESELALVRLVAPTTEPGRATLIASRAQGFLYYISRTGVTGIGMSLREGLVQEVEAFRALARVPVAVGFGVSTPEHAAEIAGVADGVVIGSALIQALEKGGAEAMETLVAGIRRALDGARTS